MLSAFVELLSYNEDANFHSYIFEAKNHKEFFHYLNRCSQLESNFRKKMWVILVG